VGNGNVLITGGDCQRQDTCLGQHDLRTEQVIVRRGLLNEPLLPADQRFSSAAQGIGEPDGDALVGGGVDMLLRIIIIVKRNSNSERFPGINGRLWRWRDKCYLETRL